MEFKDLMNYIEENKEEHFHDLIAKNEREIAKKEEEVELDSSLAR